MNNSDHLPIVSIVTPSFNQGQFIEDTILSVLNQNYPKIEYLIIDGGSNDGSVEIIKKYENKLAYWISEKDNGQTHAINKGWAISNGEIIAWLNSDDTYVNSNVVSEVVRNFIDNPQWGMLYGDCWIVNEKGERENRDGYLDNLPAIPFNINSFLLRNHIGQPASFFKKEVVLEVGGLNEKLHYGMDFDLFAKIGLRFKIGNLHNVPLAKFRVHSKAITSKLGISFVEEMSLLFKQITSNKLFPDSSKNVLNVVLSNLYFEQADRYISYAEHKKARHFLWKSIWKYPGIIRMKGISKFTSIVFWSLIGERTTKYSIRIKEYIKDYLDSNRKWDQK